MISDMINEDMISVMIADVINDRDVVSKVMSDQQIKKDGGIDWRETSKLSGSNICSKRLEINGKRLDDVIKILDRGDECWQSKGKSIGELFFNENGYGVDMLDGESTTAYIVTQILENFDKQRKEWESEREKLSQGLMMYQYRLMEYERKLKLLPAPVEVVSSRLKELEQTLEEERCAKEKLACELAEERKKPLWKKLIGAFSKQS